jgi:hypothetical protein
MKGLLLFAVEAGLEQVSWSTPLSVRPLITCKLITLVSLFSYHRLRKSHELKRQWFSLNRTQKVEDKDKKSNMDVQVTGLHILLSKLRRYYKILENKWENRNNIL